MAVPLLLHHRPPKINVAPRSSIFSHPESTCGSSPAWREAEQGALSMWGKVGGSGRRMIRGKGEPRAWASPNAERPPLLPWLPAMHRSPSSDGRASNRARESSKSSTKSGFFEQSTELGTFFTKSAEEEKEMALNQASSSMTRSGGRQGQSRRQGGAPRRLLPCLLLPLCCWWSSPVCSSSMRRMCSGLCSPMRGGAHGHLGRCRAAGGQEGAIGAAVGAGWRTTGRGSTRGGSGGSRGCEGDAAGGERGCRTSAETSVCRQFGSPARRREYSNPRYICI